jgi:hypothetical protein
MLIALGISDLYGAVEAALVTAIERAVAALGAGTVLALALVGLVLGVEALARRWRRPA